MIQFSLYAGENYQACEVDEKTGNTLGLQFFVNQIRLSRLFRTKSCNGGSGGGDGAGKRPSGELVASAASLTDMGGSAGRELDAGR